MKQPPIVNQTGICFYTDDSNIIFDECRVTSFTILETANPNRYRIHFDINDSLKYAGGIVKGFIEDGKFSGILNHQPDSGTHESWSGNYIAGKSDILITGKIFIDNEENLGFYIEIKKSGVNKKINIATNKFSFDTALYGNLIKFANNLKDGKVNTSYYPRAISLKLKPNTENDLYIAMCIAYSWMPTMLDIYMEGEKSLREYVAVVQNFSKIRSVKTLTQHEDTIRKDLVTLAKLVNNSMVGSSKMLHLFYPKHIPIMDSRVLNGWYQFFHKNYVTSQELKLPQFLPANIESQVDVYFKYWMFLMKWKEQVEGATIREMEESLYWIGKYIKN